MGLSYGEKTPDAMKILERDLTQYNKGSEVRKEKMRKSLMGTQ